MPFSSDLKRTSIFIKLYFLPSVIVLCGMVVYGLIHTQLQRATYSSVLALETSLDTPLKMPLKVSFESPIAKEVSSYRVAVSVLNVRTRATTDSAVKSRLYQSEVIEVLEVQDGWGKIDEGWVLLSYLERV